VPKTSGANAGEGVRLQRAGRAQGREGSDRALAR
jgi:hypothetical protein